MNDAEPEESVVYRGCGGRKAFSAFGGGRNATSPALNPSSTPDARAESKRLSLQCKTVQKITGSLDI